MLDTNMIIANNIQSILRQQNRRQIDLADAIQVPKQTMSRMLNGARTISAMELKQIADALHVSMDQLVRVPATQLDTNAVHAFMGRVNTEKARQAISTADRVSDMIVFYNRVAENNKEMNQPWEDAE